LICYGFARTIDHEVQSWWQPNGYSKIQMLRAVE
jgi:hypothetical protein